MHIFFQHSHSRSFSGTQANMKSLAYCLHIRNVSLYGFIFFLPISIAFSQTCLTFLFLTYLAEAMLLKFFSFPRTPLNLPLFGYVALTLLVTPFSVNVSRSIKGLEGLLTIGVFYLLYLSIHDFRHIKRITIVLLLSITLAAFYGIVQHYSEVDVFRLSKPVSFLKHVENDLRAPVRITGFSSYMTFSGQLAMTMPLLCVCFLGVKNALKKGLLAVSILLVCLALVWTFTRSAWLGTVGAITVIGILRGKKNWYIFLLFFVLLTIVAVQPELLDNSLRVFRHNDIERLYTWKSTLHMIWDYPLTGIGKGNYSRIVDTYRKPYADFKFSSRAHAHNNLLQVTVESGIPSVFCFLWLWSIIFQSLYQTYRQCPEENVSLKMLSLGCFGALIAFFIHGFSEYNFGDSEVAMMMWMIVALSLKLQDLIIVERKGAIGGKEGA